MLPSAPIPPEYAGWWRIVQTSVWPAKSLDLLGPALLSFGPGGGRLRFLAILAHVSARFVRDGISFTWEGSSEYDPVTGTGRARLAKDGRLHGKIAIGKADACTFVAERTAQPPAPIPETPPHRMGRRRT